MTSDVLAPASETTAANGHGANRSATGMKALLIGSIGVVYGDIGTSPLYALREAVVAAAGSHRRRRAGRCARRGLADPLGVDHRGDDEIRRDSASRRQSRRRWNAGVDGAGAARCQPR